MKVSNIFRRNKNKKDEDGKRPEWDQTRYCTKCRRNTWHNKSKNGTLICSGCNNKQ